ncbi:MAG TPA: TAT-variant-translocated molybdopterin oxidoreductase, partial [Gammaproteobacteria bacterium]|nr:TAT-variant-translocated molybdopterin oxidoreductase [Gammaproteobacteria bacterium]
MSATADRAPLDLAAIRARLEGRGGREYWRSLEEIAEIPGFDAFVESEFPRLAPLWQRQIDRRTLLKLMAGSVAFAATAGLAGCGRPIGEIVPYVNMPEGEIPGRPMIFATSLTLDGRARGVLAKSYTGRPTFVEGNAAHPGSLGAIDAYAQASIEQLYDPDRAQAVTFRGLPDSWDNFVNRMTVHAGKLAARHGDGFAILTGTITSPSLRAEIDRVRGKFPGARWYAYEPVTRETVYAGARLAFGETVETIYRLDRAEVIVSLDADFLGAMPGHLAYARQFIARRKQRGGSLRMSRVYALAGTPTITSAAADHAWSLASAEIEVAARTLATRLGVAGMNSFQTDPSGQRGGREPAADFFSALDAVVEDLQRHRGRAVVVPGDHQTPAVHAIAHAINERLDAVGRAVAYVQPIQPQDAEPLPALADAIDAGEVDTLLVLGPNPVYDAPADLDFARRYANVRQRIHWSLYEDETTYASYWHIPATHELETWGDSLAYDGTVSLAQPLIAPIYGGHSARAVLRAVAGFEARNDYALLKRYWRRHYRQYARNGEQFEAFWRRSIQLGLIEGSAPPPGTPRLRGDLPQALPAPPAAEPNTLYIQFLPDDSIWDGRYANSAWLQELPRRLTKLTWDNVVMLSPRAAERLGIDHKELVELNFRGASVIGPAWIMPGQPDNAVTVTLGYGRTRAGRLGTGVGFNVYPLRRSDTPWFAPGLKLAPTGRHVFLATTQAHQRMEGRGLLRTTTLDEYRKRRDWIDDYLGKPPKPDESLYPEPSEKPPLEYRWAMAIDLTACIGCEACVIACQSENNIQSVGKEEVLAGHEMHWLRIDRYYSGDLENPQTFFQPVPCMQCENAPCEYVCPVEASVHANGLNAQVYNRCIGTRDCSQNCPYKVRRFNWFRYQT